MDFLFSKGMRKMPKIPDKNNSYSFQSKKFSHEEFTSTLHNNYQDTIRQTTERIDCVKTYNYIF